MSKQKRLRISKLTQIVGMLTMIQWKSYFITDFLTITVKRMLS